MKLLRWINRNKWFGLAFLFLLVNTTALYRADRFGGPPKAEVQLLRDTNAPLRELDPLVWKFSGAMVNPGRIGLPLRSEPGTIKPEMDGYFCWEAEDLLVFKPAKPWPAGIVVTAGLDRNLKTLSGQSIASPRTFNIRTVSLEWTGLSQHSFNGDTAVVMLEFNRRVRQEDLKKYLQVTEKNGKDLSWNSFGEVASSNLLIQVETAGEDRLTLSLKESLVSEDRAPLTGESRMTIRVRPDLAFGNMVGMAPAEGPCGIQFRFNQPLDLATARHFIRVEPEVPFFLSRRSDWFTDTTHVLTGPFEPGQIYSVTFLKGLKNERGMNTLGREAVYHVQIPHRESLVRFRYPGNYMSPDGNLRVPVVSVNRAAFPLQVKRLLPDNILQYAMRDGGHYRSWFWRGSDYMLTKTVTSVVVKVDTVPNEPVSTTLDLRKLIGEDPRGTFVLEIEREGYSKPEQKLVAITDTGITVKRWSGGVLVWANSIRTLAPVNGAAVKVFAMNRELLHEGVTGEDGLVRFESGPEDAEPYLVTVQKAEDLSFLRMDNSAISSGYDAASRTYTGEGHEAMLMTDRGVYRPGETAHVKAVVRNGDLSVPGSFPVELEVINPDGRVRSVHPAMLNEESTAGFEIELKDHDQSGIYHAHIRVPGSDVAMGSISFLVEDFAPPRLAVTMTLEPDRLSVTGGPPVAVSGRYLFGAPASLCPIKARAEVYAVDFAHPSWAGYTFSDPEKEFSRQSIKLGDGFLDPEGKAQFTLEYAGKLDPPSALGVTIAATVSEKGGRAVTAFITRALDVYPHYLGLKPEPGETDEVSFRMTCVRPDGSPVTLQAPLKAALSRVHWSSILGQDDEGEYRYESHRILEPVSTWDVPAPDEGRNLLTFTPPVPGEYILTVADPHSGASVSTWVSYRLEGDTSSTWSMEAQHRLGLSFDKGSYRPGDTAELTIRSPFPGKALITLDRDRVLTTYQVEVEKQTGVLRIPVTDAFRPNIHCAVTLIKPVIDGDLQGAWRANGSIPLRMDPELIRMPVEIVAAGQARPNSPLEVSVRIPENTSAEIILAAVDEGVCMLTDFQTPDPVSFFFAERKSTVLQHDLYALLMPEIPDSGISGSFSHTGGDKGILLKGRLNPVKSRRYQPLALWMPGLRPDTGGVARATIELPMFTGSLRLMAVAIASNRFGSARANTEVRSELTVMPHLPRFLAPGDRALFQLELINRSDEGGEVFAEVRASGPLLVGEGSGSLAGKVTLRRPLPAGESMMIPLNLVAEEEAGLGVLDVVVRQGGEEHVERIELPVRPPAAAETVFGTVRIEPGTEARIPLEFPWMPGTAEQSVFFSGLPGVELQGGLDYLLKYPYGCLEQTVSASLPLLSLRSLLEGRGRSLAAGDVAPLVKGGVSRILSMQLANGGFAWWPHTRNETVEGSVYAVHFLVEARKSGYSVPSDQYEKALNYLRSQLGRTQVRSGEAGWRSDWEQRAYICHVLALAGQPDEGWMTRLAERELTADGQAHLALAFAAAGIRRNGWDELNEISQAAFSTEPEEQGSLASSVKRAALVLMAFLEYDPGNSNIPLLVHQLNQARTNGCWLTTHDNAFAVMALGRYMEQLGDEPDSFTAHISMGAFNEVIGAEGAGHPVVLPEPGILMVTNSGPGPVYAGWHSRGVPPAAKAGGAADSLLKLQRRILGLDGKPVNLARVTGGDVLVVELRVDTMDQEIDNLVVEDLLPAGFEIESPNLKTSEVLPDLGGKEGLPVRHHEMRDDRMLVFLNKYRGSGTYHYLVRAVSAGTYVLPAAAASCMYNPGIYSRTDSGNITIASPSASGAARDEN